MDVDSKRAHHAFLIKYVSIALQVWLKPRQAQSDL